VDRVALMNDPVKALTQSFTRTKSTDYASFKKTMDLHTNSSNNTIFADARGNIAYFHGNYIPRRDTKFDWNAARGWQRIRPQIQGPAVRGRDAAPAESRQRLAVQLQQLAVVGRRSE
jgi:acyl-homoserine lactone acylase PvdQ